MWPYTQNPKLWRNIKKKNYPLLYQGRKYSAVKKIKVIESITYIALKYYSHFSRFENKLTFQYQIIGYHNIMDIDMQFSINAEVKYLLPLSTCGNSIPDIFSNLTTWITLYYS